MAQKDFLSTFIGSRPRAQLLRVFMFNPNEQMTESQLGKRSGISKKPLAREVKALENLGIVKRGRSIAIQLGNGTKIASKARVNTWKVNPDCKHLRALSLFVHDVSPVQYDSIIGALRRTGKVSAIILSGSFMGDATRPADMIVAADGLNERRLGSAIRALEPVIGREIRYAAFSTPEFRYRMTIQDRLIRDTLDFPHMVLLDKTRLL